MPTEVLDDEQLAAHAANGNQQAIETLFERYFDRVYDLVLGMVRNRETAADVAQTTFLKVMEHLRKSPPPRGFRAWLYTIARNTAMDEFRRNKRLASMPAMVTDEGDELAIEPEAPAVWAEPERVVADEETVQLVWDATAGLSPDDHALLDLHLRKGLEPAEIATVVGSTPGAVYTRLTRLRDALEASVTALLLYRRRRNCQELDALVERYAETDLTPRLRKAINRHLEDCVRCQQSRKVLLTAGALFGAVPIFAAPPHARAAALSLALDQAAAAAGHPSAPARTDEEAPVSLSKRAVETARWAKVALAALAATGLFAGGWWSGAAWHEQAATGAQSVSVTVFRLIDPATGSAEMTRSLALTVDAQVAGQAGGWILTEEGRRIPAPMDPRWTSAIPEHIQLSTGEGPRTVFLWAKDEAGRVGVSSATIVVDTAPPPAPVHLRSPSHIQGLASPSNHITVAWSPAIDPEPRSGLAGYMAAWDASGGKEPSEITLGPDARESTSAALSPGEWWFVIRTVDRAGNVGPAARVGPFVIASPPPRVEPTRPAEAAPAQQLPRQEPAPVSPVPGTRR